MSRDPNAERIEREAVEAGHPFVVFSIMARNAERVAAGEVLEGCFPSDVEPEGWEIDQEKVDAWLAESAANRHHSSDGCPPETYATGGLRR